MAEARSGQCIPLAGYWGGEGQDGEERGEMRESTPLRGAVHKRRPYRGERGYVETGQTWTLGSGYLS